MRNWSMGELGLFFAGVLCAIIGLIFIAISPLESEMLNTAIGVAVAAGGAGGFIGGATGKHANRVRREEGPRGLPPAAE